MPLILYLSDDSLRKKEVVILQNQNQNNIEEDFDVAADNALIERIEAEVLAESGVTLDQLINPSTVVNLVQLYIQHHQHWFC